MKCIVGIILNAYAQLGIRDQALVWRLSSVARSMPGTGTKPTNR